MIIPSWSSIVYLSTLADVAVKFHPNNHMGVHPVACPRKEMGTGPCTSAKPQCLPSRQHAARICSSLAWDRMRSWTCWRQDVPGCTSAWWVQIETTRGGGQAGDHEPPAEPPIVTRQKAGLPRPQPWQLPSGLVIAFTPCKKVRNDKWKRQLLGGFQLDKQQF